MANTSSATSSATCVATCVATCGQCESTITSLVYVTRAKVKIISSRGRVISSCSSFHSFRWVAKYRSVLFCPICPHFIWRPQFQRRSQQLGLRSGTFSLQLSERVPAVTLSAINSRPAIFHLAHFLSRRLRFRLRLTAVRVYKL